MNRRILGLLPLLAGCQAAEDAAVRLRSSATLIESADEELSTGGPAPVPGDIPSDGPIAGAPPDAWVVVGQVEAQTEARLGFEVPGEVESVLVSAGSAVRRGDVLGRLGTTDRARRLADAKDLHKRVVASLPVGRRSSEQPPEYLIAEMQARLDELREALDSQQADRSRLQRAAELGGEEAARDLAIALSRRRSKPPSRRVIERAAKDRLNQELVDELASRINTLEFGMRASELRSPIDGVVVEVGVGPGEEWNTRSGGIAFHVVEPSSFVVRATLPEARARLLAEGEPVWLELHVGERVGMVDGAVRTLDTRVWEATDPAGESLGRRRLAWFAPARIPAGLRPGEIARVALLQ